MLLLLNLVLLLPQEPVHASSAPGREATAVPSRLWWGDFDGDSLADLVMAGADGRALLLHNLGEGAFEDVTAGSGLEALALLALASWADVDGDERLDLLAIGEGASPRLFRSLGAGVFEEARGLVGELGAKSIGAVRGFGWVDLDGDALPDLQLVTEEGDRLYRNRGAGRFERAVLPETAASFPMRSPAGPPAHGGEAGERAAPRSSAGVGAVDAERALDARPTTLLGVAEAETGGAVERGGARAAAPAASSLASPTGTLPAKLGCLPAVRDAATGSCVSVSSVPLLGALYPLGPELFIDGASGFVGVGTTSPGYALEVAGQLVSGSGNTATGPSAAIGGGSANNATGEHATIAGGEANQALADDAFIGGGISNLIVGQRSVIAGGVGNVASNSAAIGGGEQNDAFNFATVAGGRSNDASALGASIGGGANNLASGLNATIGGGGDGTNALLGNTASGEASTVSGGQDNLASGKQATISGGTQNQATAEWATIGGGADNEALDGCTVCGGWKNDATELVATVGGGSFNTADGFASTVSGGDGNSALAPISTIGGGGVNLVDATADRGVVAGGYSNQVLGMHGFVGGGEFNTASGEDSAISGGQGNVASGKQATISGGVRNQATADWATVGGGADNEALDGCTVCGGWKNDATELFATVGGGTANTADGFASTVSGGDGNSALAPISTIGGGGVNLVDATADRGVVAGGYSNQVLGMHGSVGGGEFNTASGAHAAIPGGSRNRAGGAYTLAAGRRAKADHDGAFVWADSTDADFVSTGPDQLLIRAGGGVGIGTNAPAVALHVGTGSDASPTGGGYVQAGATTGDNIAIDGNEIMARSNGATSDLNLNADGGDVYFFPNGNGSVGIGTNAPGFTLEVAGTAGKPGGGSWSVASDRRLKTDVAELEDALATLLALRGVSFAYVDPAAIGELPGTRIGFIAQEVEGVLPDWVEERADGTKMLTVRGFEALCVEALRELTAENERLGGHVNQVGEENAELQARLQRLEAALGRLDARLAARGE